MKAKYTIFLLFYCFLSFTYLLADNVLLLNDTSAWYHWGCTGTSTALKEEVVNLGHTLTAIPINITKECKNTPTKLSEFDDLEFFRNFCDANPELMQKIASTDILLINGEGTIHGMHVGPRALLYLAYAAKKYLHKHVEIINHSIYPEDTLDLNISEATEIYKLVYGYLDFIGSRDAYSTQLMTELGIPVTQTFDCLPLYIERHYSKTKVVKVKNIVLAGSASVTQAGVKATVDCLEKFRQQGYKIKVLIGAKAFPIAEDALLKYLKAYPEASNWEIVDAQSMDEWLNAINNASLLLSGRFHHSIAAACLRTPFVALNSNTPKVDAIMDMMGMPRPLQYDEEDLSEKMRSRCQQALSPSYKHVDVPTLEMLRCLAKHNFDGLRS